MVNAFPDLLFLFDFTSVGMALLSHVCAISAHRGGKHKAGRRHAQRRSQSTMPPRPLRIPYACEIISALPTEEPSNPYAPHNSLDRRANPRSDVLRRPVRLRCGCGSQLDLGWQGQLLREVTRVRRWRAPSAAVA